MNTRSLAPNTTHPPEGIVANIAVGSGYRGRIVNALGSAMDGMGAVEEEDREHALPIGDTRREQYQVPDIRKIHGVSITRAPIMNYGT